MAFIKSGGLVFGYYIRRKQKICNDHAWSRPSKIASFLHFSVPDEGPLSDYEKWMPDFMKGLAGGIERNRKLVKNAGKMWLRIMHGSTILRQWLRQPLVALLPAILVFRRLP